MAALGRLGLVGLALVPGGARHPFTYGAKGFEVPADYRREVVNTRVGGGVEAIVAALGATTDHSVGEARTRKVGARKIAGIEASFQQLGAVTLPAVVASNLTLYTKFDVVIMRRSVYASLSTEQRRQLEAIVREGVQAGVARRDTEQAGLERWCSSPSTAAVQLSPGRARGVSCRPGARRR